MTTITIIDPPNCTGDKKDYRHLNWITHDHHELCCSSAMLFYHRWRRSRQLSHIMCVVLLMSISLVRSNDLLDDGIFDALSPDPDCQIHDFNNNNPALFDSPSCWYPPASTIEAEEVSETNAATPSDTTTVCPNESGDQHDSNESMCPSVTISGSDKPRKQKTVVDKHWGSDPIILKMRDKLRGTFDGAANSNNTSNHDSRRPPVFLLPGLASTRLVAWRYKPCQSAPLLSNNIKVQDNVWLNLQLLLRMGTVDVDCMKECLQLGPHQQDGTCKLRPDEGLDAISSLAPGGFGSHLLVGGTNTVYAWLIQWLADNLGYDVTTLYGLPYDWRLSPDRMQERDGFLTWMRRTMETAVDLAQQPGILVAHSMGNLIFRYFLEWLRHELRHEAYQRMKLQVELERKRKNKIRSLSRQMAQARMQELDVALQGKAISQESPVLNVDGNNDVDSDDDDIVIGSQEATEKRSKFWSGWISGTSTGASADEDRRLRNHSDVSGRGESTTELPVTSAIKVKKSSRRHQKLLLELAQIEGDDKWHEWIEKHIWTYVGLSAPMLGAVNPLRAVISGENMGLPISDEVARVMELTFGSTNTVIPISSKMAFCDDWRTDRWDEEPLPKPTFKAQGNADDDSALSNINAFDVRLACLDDIMANIESHSTPINDPWQNFPALKSLLKDRADWDSDFSMVEIERCSSVGNVVKNQKNRNTSCHILLGPGEAQSGELFKTFGEVWKEEGEPLLVKREQLLDSFHRNAKVPNMLNTIWERPLIKHIIMAYGVDIPTEVGYVYKKKQQELWSSDSPHDGLPTVQKVIWEEPFGQLMEERVERERSGGLTEVLIRKKAKRLPLNGGYGNGTLPHSGDGTIPYLSLSWAHTWLLHASRALRYDHKNTSLDDYNPLEQIEISHRPKGAMKWISGPPPNVVDRTILKLEQDSDTGTLHPHGTKYKPEMVRYHNVGNSRISGIEYSTTIIEAIGVEHKETTRNYDVLAACFTDVLKYMHNDFGLV